MLGAGTAEGRVSGLHREDGVAASADVGGRTVEVAGDEQSVDMVDGREDEGEQADGGALVGRAGDTGSIEAHTRRTGCGHSPSPCASTRHNNH